MKRLLPKIARMITAASIAAVTLFTLPAQAALLPPGGGGGGTGGSGGTQAQALCTGSGGTWNGTACDNASGPSVVGTIRAVSNILMFLLGAIAVIMIIVGGIRYVTSSGDQNAVTSAKNTILYAIIGLVVAFIAYAIVAFVTSQIH